MKPEYLARESPDARLPVWDRYWSKVGRSDVKSFRKKNPYYRLLRRLLDFANIDRCRVLELGCGSGMMTVALLDDIKGIRCEAHLVDLSTIALRLARENSAVNRIDMKLIRSDAFRLPFPDDCFDIVYNEGLNEHFKGERRQAIFDEMVRVCRPGGQVAVIVPNIANMPYRMEKRVLEKRDRWEFGYEQAYSCRELIGRMSKAGVRAGRMSGTKVARPMIDLLKLIFAYRAGDPSGDGGESDRRIAFGGFLDVIDDFLGRHLWLAARDIGLSGRKMGA
jgi:SAM-dependent methyltransferase